MPDGTLFPSLDGSTPGDNKDTGQIMEAPLPDLFGDSPVMEKSTVAPVAGPGEIQAFGTPDTVPSAQSVDPALADAGDLPRRGGAERRIGILTRRIYDGQAREARQANEIAALTHQLSQLNAKFSSLSAPRAPATALQGSSSDPLSGVGGEASPRSGSFDEAAIARVIDERLAPLTLHLQSNQRQSALRAAHEQSFQDAASEWPELRKADSEFRQEFNRLFDSSPLRDLPDAPAQIAAQVRGILADRRRETQVTADRKRAATITSTPSAAPTASADSEGLPRDVAAQYEQAKERMRNGTASNQDQMLVVKVSRFKNARKAGAY